MGAVSGQQLRPTHGSSAMAEGAGMMSATAIVNIATARIETAINLIENAANLTNFMAECPPISNCTLVRAFDKSCDAHQEKSLFSLAALQLFPAATHRELVARLDFH
jgi:hypothetical protein